MLNRIARPFTTLVERYLPDPFVFVLLLSLIVIGSAIFATNTPSVEVLQIWGNGFWDLLSFSMQMLLILLCGYMLASTPVCNKLLHVIATIPKTRGQAIIAVTLVAMCASWLNWGFGLVVGVLFAKAIARRIEVDYRVLVASSYSGFIVWHGGLSGSVPLTIATENHFMASSIGVVATEFTLFSSFNLAILCLLLITLPLLNRGLLPPAEQQVLVKPELLNEPVKTAFTINTPAEKLEHSHLLGLTVGLLGLGYLACYFLFFNGSLSLNSVIAIFLFLAITLHKTPANILQSLNQAISSGAGIIIQFPFYAALMAVMVKTGLAANIAAWFMAFSDASTLPFWSFISAGFINIMVPSGGGQWAVQAPIVIPAALELNADVARVAMAVAWGDAWTNLIQPFWALPVLALAGLKAKDIMGFCLLQLVVAGVIIATILTFWPA